MCLSNVPGDCCNINLGSFSSFFEFCPSLGLCMLPFVSVGPDIWDFVGVKTKNFYGSIFDFCLVMLKFTFAHLVEKQSPTSFACTIPWR